MNALVAIAVLGIACLVILGGAAIWDVFRTDDDLQPCWIPEPHPWHPGCWQTPTAPTDQENA